jgi:hypothetical protein
MEIWKDIDFTNGDYQVSNFGNVRSMERIIELSDGRKRKFDSRYLRPKKSNCYLAISIKRKNYDIHRLVAKAFIDNPEGKKCVNHKDCNKHNNHVANLEWSTHKENSQHAKNNLRFNPKKSSNHPLSRGVVQYDLEKNIIKKWDCMSDAMRAVGGDLSSLHKHLNGRKGYNSVKGYKFEYVN